MKYKFFFYVLFALIVLIVCSCAPKSSQIAPHIKRPAGETLEQSVKAYWNYLIKGDLFHAYDYEHAAFTKKLSRDFYQKKYMKGYEFKAMKILSIGKQGEGPEGSTKVIKEIKYSLTGVLFPVPKELKIKRTDYWVKEKDGRWYHLISNPVAGKFY